MDSSARNKTQKNTPVFPPTFVLWISQLLARTPRDSMHKRATRREKKTRRKKINSEAAPFFRRQQGLSRQALSMGLNRNISIGHLLQLP
ncbi:hypothetical protein OIU85_019351 [Salix viminalis]|uniref:Uncharacterized protein n=1 Tax=Salix viminalis TaxID=40686 RepID=A0A9Q0ZK20_SALVM|nr:hypothetical protein OIU85_019351 [Salix viminalis]